MTIQPGDPRAGHHQARNTQELLDAADQVGERQEQRYNRDPSTDEIPVPDQNTDIPVPADSREPRGTETREPASQASAEPLAQQTDSVGQQADLTAQQSDPMDRQPTGEPVAEPAAEPTTEQAATDQAAVGQASAGQHSERRENHAQNDEDEHVALFDQREAEELRGRWREVQSAFVDDPRSAVQGADQLVAQVIQSLTASFAAHKNELDGQWQGSDESGPATEDLRLALRRYRTLFNQLLNT
jgi:hypothetical protein